MGGRSESLRKSKEEDGSCSSDWEFSLLICACWAEYASCSTFWISSAPKIPGSSGDVVSVLIGSGILSKEFACWFKGACSSWEDKESSKSDVLFSSLITIVRRFKNKDCFFKRVFIILSQSIFQKQKKSKNLTFLLVRKYSLDFFILQMIHIHQVRLPEDSPRDIFRS